MAKTDTSNIRAADLKAVPASSSVDWREAGSKVWQDFSDHNISLISGGAAFFVLLALVPALAAFATLYGLIFDPTSVSDQFAKLAGQIPVEARAVVEEQLKRLTSQPKTELGAAFAATLLFSLWSASSATKSLFEGLNVVHQKKERRSFFRFNATALIFTFVGIFGMVAFFAVAIALPVILQTLFPDSSTWLASLAASVTLLLALWVAIVSLYRWGPNLNGSDYRWLAPGSLLAVVGLAIFSWGFSFYARTFSAFNAYGSIGAVIGFMTWIWICLMIILLGAEINAALDRQAPSASQASAFERA